MIHCTELLKVIISCDKSIMVFKRHEKRKCQPNCIRIEILVCIQYIYLHSINPFSKLIAKNADSTLFNDRFKSSSNVMLILSNMVDPEAWTVKMQHLLRPNLVDPRTLFSKEIMTSLQPSTVKCFMTSKNL